jgi:hypothetical protein
MNNNSVPASYIDGGGLLFGLFCFYVICFGLAWRWGASQRDDMRKRVVEEQIEKTKSYGSTYES